MIDYLAKLFADIFSMGFDYVIPVSGNIIAIVVAVVLFSLRYASFRNKVRKYGTGSRHAKLTPRRMPIPLSPVDDAPACDPQVAAFLSRAVRQRAHGVVRSDDRSVDARLVGALGEELRAHRIGGADARDVWDPVTGRHY